MRRSKYYIILTVVFLFTIYYNKDYIFKNIGDESFGGCCYNLTIAEMSYKIMRLQRDGQAPPQWANHQLARIKFVKGELYTALEYIDNELLYYPDNLNSYYIKGLILGFIGRDHDAIEVFKYYTNNRKTWAGHNDLAWLYFKIGDYQNALMTVDKVINDYTNNIWLLNAHAMSLYNLGRYKEAQSDIDKAESSYKEFTPDSWGASYPGNNPKIYNEGYTQMGKTIKENKELIYAAVNKSK